MSDEIRNQFKYTLLPDGSVPVFLNGNEEEYRIPEDELKSFINYHGNSNITAGTQWFVPGVDDIGQTSYTEYIVPATDTSLFNSSNPDAYEGYVYGDIRNVFDAMRNEVPYKLDPEQKLPLLYIWGLIRRQASGQMQTR